MFKNHNAIKEMKKLDPSIVLVEWDYDGDVNKRGNMDVYHDHSFAVTGLAGYNNTRRFIPDIEVGEANIRSWAKVMKRMKGVGFGCSAWGGGDGSTGAESSRDLAWNLYAYYGELSWRGKKGPKNFQSRFQHNFYGKTSPALLRLVEQKLPQRQFNPSKIREYWRQPIMLFSRLLTQDRQFLRRAQADYKLLKSCFSVLATAKTQAPRESAQLVHYEIGLRRELFTVKRMLLADRMNRGLKGAALKKAVVGMQKECRAIEKDYKKSWLQNNKKNGIEVSLAVYDVLHTDLQNILGHCPVDSGYTELELPEHLAVFNPAVAAAPIARRAINDVPFHFAPENTTHYSLEAGADMSLSFDQQSIADLHMIYGGQCAFGEERKYLQVTVYNGKKKLFSEQLYGTRDLCNWWAPMGCHMWAGGGWKHVDHKRNQYAFNCMNRMELMHLSNFPLKGNLHADRIELRNLSKWPFELFALTLSS